MMDEQSRDEQLRNEQGMLKELRTARKQVKRKIDKASLANASQVGNLSDQSGTSNGDNYDRDD